jgi:hypothetical protein
MMNWLNNVGFGLLSGQNPLQQAEQQGFGGVPSNTQPKPQMPNRFLSDPAISNALLRMGGSTLQANSQGAGFGGSLGAGATAFSEGLAQGRDAQLRQAQMQAEIQKAQREAQFGVRSSGFEGDMARAMVVMNNPNSTDDEKRVAQSIIQTAERMTGAYDPISGEYRFNNKARLPIELSRPASAAPQETPLPQAAPMGAPQLMPNVEGGLLPPPADLPTGQERMPASSFTAPQTQGVSFTPTGNRKNDAELQRRAAELNMEIQAERDKALGKEQGTATAATASQISKLPQLEAVVSELNTLADTADYNLPQQGRNFVRRQLGLPTQDGAVARAKYIAMVDNQVLPLLRDTFGAQFTQKEGETLRQTLGDADKSPTEKKAVLEAFIEQKKRNVVSDANLAGIAPPDFGNLNGTPKPQRLKYNPQTGDFE